MKNSNNIKKYQLSNKEKILLGLNNWELDTINTINLVKFYSLEYFAELMVLSHNKSNDPKQNFEFTLIIEPNLEEELKKYLLKYKDFVIRYIVSEGYVHNSYLYQLYLQYASYYLTDIEKIIFLNCYANTISRTKGSDYALQKRKTLEKKLNCFKA